ncbi:DNA-directed RNA polymerase [Cadophora gregata]|uniref:DNA-directed RNA polymerase n=1 Tax=Cadophora gregata TaxID=51156 RepID=UPI0026DB3A0D|nr:DNA-directed RNA polymerase [Cadophora gregata]KAK0119735.1 DNA-directed RNA polymerase [Cadophora gregata]KAK0120770.1 DNA-directed RNA polymerase [Cadophora gregata f. sp. sojae]
MLVRAARRKARPESLRIRTYKDQLYLPWLCPTYNASQRGRRSFGTDTGSQVGGPRPRRNSQDAPSRPTRRALATATGYMPMDDIPFESIGTMPPPRGSGTGYGFADGNSLSALESFGSPTQLLQLGGSLAMPPHRYTKGTRGITGSISEIQSVFNACLQVGRIQRAGVILQRIAKLDGVDPNELLGFHNQYLRAAIEEIMVNPTSKSMQELHKWYELQIRSRGVPQNTDTVAYMIKASLQAPLEQRERLVRRYMDMLDENSAAQLWNAEVLTAQEIDAINHIYPKYNLMVEKDQDEEMHNGMEVDPSSLDQVVSKSPVPNVRPTGQKGLGLKSLKKALSLFSTLPTEGIDLASATAQMKRDVQTRLEEDAVTSAIDRWRDESTHLKKMGLNTALQTKSLGARMWKWQESLTEYLEVEIEKVNASEEAEKMSREDLERVAYGPFLRLLRPETLAAVTILSSMSSLGALGADKGLPLSTAIMSISRSVEDESVFEALHKESKKQMWPKSKNRLDVKDIKRAARFRMSTHRNGSGPALLDQTETFTNSPRAEWPLSVKAKVGAFLMSALIQVAKVPVTLTHPETGEVVTQMQPALSHSHQYKMGKKLGVIIVNKSLVAQMKREPVHSLLAKHLPMLVEPDPWTEFSKGGFLAHPAKVMRIKNGDKDQRHYAEAAIGQGDMRQTFKGLDVLGKTPWKINQSVFDVMLEAWNSGEGIANMPPETPNLTIPPEPEPSSDPLERRRWIREVKNVENTRSGLHSQRCFQNFQLEIARALRNEVFYFPHNIDFRGRAYPIPPYLNHIGADHCRGLLKFGVGRELGEGGLRWLKIHVANVFGFDKASLSEREAFASKHLEKIYETATNPLSGSRWWLNAEDPWQFLAACMELRNALESADPKKFVSDLPVHQDGTCNGLQHYAALGGDLWGARQVNLEPGDRPADVYSAVADLVKASIAEDAANGNEKGLLLQDKISRKVVKQTVMTNVYGVTFIGAKAQVRRQLIAAYPDLPNNDAMNAGNLAAYVATKIFTALSTMFKGAHDIQYWLGDCATRISTCLTPEQIARLESEWPRLTSTALPGNHKAASIEELVQFKSSVIWTTPLHMPVVQPYRDSKSKTIKTNMQKLSLSEPHRSDPISKRKQLQGFPPNFIHSLDATHMLLSALRCDELGLSFAAVHDSFWTHASEVDTMNKVLRDAFIRIHSEDVVGRLRDEFIARYQGAMHLATIQQDSPVLQKIKAWRETNSIPRSMKFPRLRKAPHLDELILERKRVRLLSSADPADVELGKSIVTPTSIFQEHAADEDLAASVDIKITGLGDISKGTARSAANQNSAVDDIEDGDNESEVDEIGLANDEDGPDTTRDLESDQENEEVDDRSIFEKSMNLPSRYSGPTTQVWLPLTFPPVPQKGEFDVSRLKNSQYFFS